jgi:hypothetical protein
MRPEDVFSMGRSSVARLAMTGSFEEEEATHRDAHRQYLVALVRRKIVPAGSLTIEAWRFEWDVEPLRSPPLES